MAACWESSFRPSVIPSPLRRASVAKRQEQRRGVAAGGAFCSRFLNPKSGTNQSLADEASDCENRFFAANPDDYVKCPGCSAVFVAQTSSGSLPLSSAAPPPPPPLPGSPVGAACSSPVAASSGDNTLSAETTALIPACYSSGLPAGAALTLDDAVRHLFRSRFRCSQCGTDFCRCGVSPYHWGWSCDGWQRQQHTDDESIGICRWCTAPVKVKRRWTKSKSAIASTLCCGNDGDKDLQASPPVLSCAEKEKRSCAKRHACGHRCGGVKDETECLPCLHKECHGAASSFAPSVVDRVRKSSTGCCASVGSVTVIGGSSSSSSSSSRWGGRATMPELPDRNDWCPICWTDKLYGAPAIRLRCGHVAHQHCIEAMIHGIDVTGKRLTFENIRCPICQAVASHPALDSTIGPHLTRYYKVRRLALARWYREHPQMKDADDEDVTALLTKMSFFECSQCREPYYGGEMECGADAVANEAQGNEALVCPGCASKGKSTCPTHGSEFISWKCRYCCERPASFYCFGTTHFCHTCHDAWARGPGARCQQHCLGGDKCIFQGKHPEALTPGAEYALGCTLCAEDMSGVQAAVLQPKQAKCKRSTCTIL